MVALNHYPDDHESEVSVVRQMSQKAGAVDFAVSKVFGEGGKGGLELAEKVMAACELPKEFKLLYPDEMNIRDKIKTLAQEIYGADDVSFGMLLVHKSINLKKLALETCRFAWPKPI